MNKKKKLFKIGEILYVLGVIIGFGVTMLLCILYLILGLCPNIYCVIPAIVGLGLGVCSVVLKFYAADGNIMIGMD